MFSGQGEINEHHLKMDCFIFNIHHHFCHQQSINFGWLVDRLFNGLFERRAGFLLASSFTIHSWLLYYQLNVVSNISFYLTWCHQNFSHQKNRFPLKFNLTIFIKINKKSILTSLIISPLFSSFLFSKMTEQQAPLINGSIFCL